MYEELINKLRYCGNAVSCNHCPYWEGCAGSKEDMVEAADAIEKLKKAVLRLEDESGIYDELPTFYIYPTKWIPVAERLPKEDETVMTWGKQGIVLLDWLHDNKWCCFGEATYWMPLPEPPKDGE